MKVKFGGHDLDAGGKYLLGELRRSDAFAEEAETLRARLEADGYLYLKRFHPREEVLAARRQLLERMAERELLQPGARLMDGVVNRHIDAPGSTSIAATRHLADLGGYRRVVESPRVTNFFERLCGGPVRTYDHKWLRVAATGAASSIHADAVFMGRGTERLYTCWTPFGDVPLQMGPIVLWLGSHRDERIRGTYCRMDVDRDLIEGAFSDDPVEVIDKFGGVWASTDFEVGDALIFGIHLLHASLTNLTDRYRISVDARYQLASESIDERWADSPPLGHYAFKKAGVSLEPLSVSRTRWGW